MNDNNVYTLYAPATEASFRAFRRDISRNSKDYAWRYVHFIVSTLRGRTIRWEGCEALRDTLERATRMTLEKKSSTQKEVLVDFYCGFYGNPRNAENLIAATITSKGKELANLIVGNGALLFDIIAAEMQWKKFRYDGWNSEIDSDSMSKWTTLPDVAPLAVGAFFVEAVSPIQDVSKFWYSRNGEYVVPEGSLIAYVASTGRGEIAVKGNPSDSEPGLTLFDGGNLLYKIDTMQSLLLTRSVVPGGTKIGINTAKKLDGYLKLPPFPAHAKTVMSRAMFIADMACLQFGNPGNIRFPKKPIEVGQFVRGMFGVASLTSDAIVKDIFADKLRFRITELVTGRRNSFSALFDCIKSVANKHDGGKGLWLKYGAFETEVTYQYARNDNRFIMPTEYSESPEAVRDPDGGQVYMYEFRPKIHDVIFTGMIEAMAAVGAFDLLFNEQGAISYLRLTPLGRYCMGLSQQLPEGALRAGSSGDEMEVDCATGMIVLKQPEVPFIGLIEELAEKITPVRYCITEKSLAAGCRNMEMLNDKVKKLTTFLVPKPSGKVKQMIDNLKARSKGVTRTPGGTMYTLYSIDPADEELQRLIVNNPEIRENTLRVEGCKLLVRSNFVDEFFRILARAGFLCS